MLAEQYRNHQPLFSSPAYTQVSCGQFTPDGRHLVVGLTHPAYYVYSTSNWKATPSIVDLSGDDWKSVSVIRFLPDGRGMVVAGVLSDGRGAFGFAKSVGESPTVKHTFPSEVTDVAVADTGCVLVATRNGEIQAWHMDSPEPVWMASAIEPNDESRINVDLWDTRTYVSTAGDFVAATVFTNDAFKAKVWSLNSGELITKGPAAHFEQYVQFSSVPSQFALAHHSGIDLLRIEGDELVAEKRIPHRSVVLAFAPNGGEVAAADYFGGVQIFDLATTRQIDRVVHVTGGGWVSGLCYSPDGTLLASSDRFGTLKVFDVASNGPAVPAIVIEKLLRSNTSISHRTVLLPPFRDLIKMSSDCGILTGIACSNWVATRV